MQIIVDGRPVAALAGQSLAGALHSAGFGAWRHNQVTGEPRAAFCGMGVCFECEVTVNGRPYQRACLVHVDDGMVVTTEGGAGTRRAQ